jgi:hypothetical protein
MIVSEWCSMWLQRQGVPGRMAKKEAKWYTAVFIQEVRKAVPWPHSCQRESAGDM